MSEFQATTNKTAPSSASAVNPTRVSLVYALGSGVIGLAELVVGWMSGSLALIADSIHSITDVLAGLIGAIAAAIARKKPDANHPFGHSRAEPLGAFMVAVLTALLGLNILQMGIANLIEKQQPHHEAASYWVLVVVLVFKAGFYLWTRAHKKSAMIRALSIDSRNDCLASIATLTVILASSSGLPWLDQVFALVIGGIILYSGFQIARENIAMLMGEIPKQAFFDEVDHHLKSIVEVLDYEHFKAHFVGPEIHLALTIRLDPSLSLSQAHQIEHRVTEKLMNIEELTAVFIHIEPYPAKPN